MCIFIGCIYIDSSLVYVGVFSDFYVYLGLGREGLFLSLNLERKSRLEILEF